MSIIVKGMRIPKNCWKCMETKLNIAVSVFGGMCPYCEKIRTDHDMETGRHPECPLGALPDHHGRLVDADELNFSSMLDSIDQGIAEETVMDAHTIVEAEGEK